MNFNEFEKITPPEAIHFSSEKKVKDSSIVQKFHYRGRRVSFKKTSTADLLQKNSLKSKKDKANKHIDKRSIVKQEKLKKKIQITSQKVNQVELEAMYHKPEKVQYPEDVHYLDENRLLKGIAEDQPIHPIHRDWFIHQAALLESMKTEDLRTKQQLQLAMLHAYSKAATINRNKAEHLNIQTSPLLPQNDRYHRSTLNTLLDKVEFAYAKALELEPHELFLIDSPLFREVFARELPHPDLDLNIDSYSKFETLFDQLLSRAQVGQFPQDRLLIDFSALLEQMRGEPKDFRQIVMKLEDILLRKLNEFVISHPGINKDEIADQLLSMFHVIAFTEHQDQPILLTPEFLLVYKEPEHYRFNSDDYALLSRIEVKNRHGIMNRLLDDMIRRTGFRISPDQAKETWLRVTSYQEILKELGIPASQFATRGNAIPMIFHSFNDFVNHPLSKKFKDLSHQIDAAPYLQILPQATWELLEGLAREQTILGGIDKIFQDKGVADLLQISYFRMQNAMQEAILHKNDLVIFQNQIELIHQEIQTILAIVEPYDETSFANSISTKLTEEPNPLVPSDLEPPKVHLKASAMHGLSSILASVEAQKGSHQLHVAVLKDSYYESTQNLNKAKTHQVHILNGDQFQHLGINQAFDKPPSKSEPIDLFVCEFHHNISTTRQVYHPEDVLGQIKALIAQDLVTDKFTVAIDTTIDLEQSDDVRNLLADPTIKHLVQQGRLNLVFLRSAQKFDMLGIDNYYGGITMSINHQEAFSHFNTRMNAPNDQLRGLSYQGLAHLQKYAGKNLDRYRQAIMNNTRKLYHQLPQEAIYQDGMTNPMQISKIEDERLIYLDIKFPNHPKAAKAFAAKLLEFAEQEKLPLTTRASFGFSNTNFSIIEGRKFRLVPGLEDEKKLERYAAFFQSVQKTIHRSMRRTANISLQKIDEKLAKSLASLTVPQK